MKNRIIKTLSIILSALLLAEILPFSVFAENLSEESFTKVNFDTKIEESYIIGEDESKREENTKHFRRADGSYVAAEYNYPVHFETEDGWEELDFSLQKQRDDSGKTSYKIADGQSYAVSVPENIVSEPLTYSYKGYSIGMSYLGQIPAESSDGNSSVPEEQTTETETEALERSEIADERDATITEETTSTVLPPETAITSAERSTAKATSSSVKIKESSTAKKKNASMSNMTPEEYNKNAMILENSSAALEYAIKGENTKLDYTITAAGIKENIIVAKPQSSYRYQFALNAGELVPNLKNTNEVELLDASGAVVYTIEAPVMEDAAGEESRSIKLSISKSDELFILELQANDEWINEKDRQFPVRIDPTVRLDLAQSAIEDTYVEENNPNATRPHDYELYVGNNSLGLVRTYVKFVLPALPKYSQIVSASFAMFLRDCDVGSNSTAAVMNLYDLAGYSPWEYNTVTWNNQPIGTARNAASGMTVIDYCNFATASERTGFQWDLTKVAKSWYNGGTNNGLVVTSSNENIYPLRMRFFSAQSYIVSSNGYPSIYVAYRDTRGLEDYWSYSSYNAGDAGTVYVNDYTGNLIVVRDDVSTYGQRLPYTVSHIYNSALYDTGISGLNTGKGWQLSFQQTVSITGAVTGLDSDLQTDYPRIYKDADGTEHYFAKKDNTTLVDEDGLGLTMTLTGGTSSRACTIKDKKDNIMTFNSDGKLISIKDANNNEIDFNYITSGNVRITDGAGHLITVVNVSGSLTETDPAGRQCLHTYVNGRLDHVVTTEGRTVTYTYSNAFGGSEKLLTGISYTNTNQISITYTQSSNAPQVSQIQLLTNNSVTQTIQYDYSKHNQTTITSSGTVPTIASSTKIESVKQFDDFGRLIGAYEMVGGSLLGGGNYAYTQHVASNDSESVKKDKASKIKNHIASVGDLGAPAVNLLKDGSFERSSSNWYNSGDITGSITCANSTSASIFGTKSRKMTVPSHGSTNRYRVMQDVDLSLLKPSTFYTLSAYVKITSVSADSGGGVFIHAKTESSVGNPYFYSEYLTETTNTAIDNGWQRLSVTFQTPSVSMTKCYVGLGVTKANATVYFDAVQLEEGNAANSFNLLENAGFEMSENNAIYAWSNNNASYVKHSGTTMHDGAKGIRLTGDPFKNVKVYQAVNLPSGSSEDDTFILSFWTKANAASYLFHENKTYKTRYCIEIKIDYTTGGSMYKLIHVNPSVSEWQFVSGAFTLADGDDSSARVPTTVQIGACYFNEVNKAYFDTFALTKENVPTFVYDSDGNLITAKENAKNNQHMEYSLTNDMTSYQDGDASNAVYSYTYDNKHNLTSVTSQNQVRYDYTYSSEFSGNVTGLSVNKTGFSRSINSSIEYTANGSLISKVTDPRGKITSYEYDSAGRVTHATNPKGGVTAYTYNSTTGALASVSSSHSHSGAPVDGDPGVSFSYNADGTLQQITANNPYSFTYDGNKNLITATAGGALLSTSSYNLSTNALNSITYGNGDGWNYQYDKAGRLVFVSDNGNATRGQWSYDGKSRVTSYNDLANYRKHIYNYDVTGRFTREAVTDTVSGARLYSSAYGYDVKGNVNSIGVSAGANGASMAYAYNKDNLPTQSTVGSRSITHSYDELDRLSACTSSGVPSVSYSYINPTSSTTSALLKSEAFSDAALGSVTYAYNNNGSITSKTETVSGLSQVSTFTYDYFERMKKEYNADQLRTTRYTYDDWGNITKKRIYAGNSTSAENLLQTINYTYAASGWKDLLTAYNGQTITYDAIGNPTSYRGATMSWFGRQLESYSKSGTTVDYTYDSDGLRVSKTVNNVKHNYYYVEGKLAYEDCPSYKLFYLYDALGNLAQIRRLVSGNQPETFDVVCNSFGDVIALYEGGSLLAKYTYDSWGKLISIVDWLGQNVTTTNDIWTQNSIRYRGYVYDTETALYYLQSRYYDPETCRFINADCVGFLATDFGLNSYNLNSYCYNNPIRFVDIGGASPMDVLSLFDFRSIHQRVQEECHYRYGWAMEVYVKGEKGRGRLDLLDVTTNQYYEVKSHQASQSNRTKRQMEKYDVATIQGSATILLQPDLKKGESLCRGKRFVDDSFTHNIFDVKYYTVANGLIAYEAKINPQRAAVLSLVGITVGVALLAPEAAPVFAPMLSPVMQMLMS